MLERQNSVEARKIFTNILQHTRKDSSRKDRRDSVGRVKRHMTFNKTKLRVIFIKDHFYVCFSKGKVNDDY